MSENYLLIPDRDPVEWADAPADDLLTWGPDEERDAPVFLFEARLQGAVYWLAAHDPFEAARLLGETLDDVGDEWEPGPDETLVIAQIELERANEVAVVDGDFLRFRLANIFNRDQTPRVIACSEWTP